MVKAMKIILLPTMHMRNKSKPLILIAHCWNLLAKFNNVHSLPFARGYARIFDIRIAFESDVPHSRDNYEQSRGLGASITILLSAHFTKFDQVLGTLTSSSRAYSFLLFLSRISLISCEFESRLFRRSILSNEYRTPEIPFEISVESSPQHLFFL